eukprot:gene5003-6952_t
MTQCYGSNRSLTRPSAVSPFHLWRSQKYKLFQLSLWILFIVSSTALNIHSPASLSECLNTVDANSQGISFVGVDLRWEDRAITDAFASMVIQHANLTVLSFSHTYLNTNMLHSISTLVRNNAPIQALDFSYNVLDNSSIGLILEGVESNFHLVSLQLMGCSLDDDAVSALASALKNKPNGFQRLNLYNNHITDIGVEKLVSVVKLSESLEEIDLGMNPIGDNGAIALSEFLHKDTVLRSFRLSSIQASASGFHELITGLMMSSVEHVDLSKNVNMGYLAIQAVGMGLAMMKNLAHLDLSLCPLGDEGTAYVQSSLQICPTLRSLALVDTGITANTSFAVFISEHRKLSRLDLSHNHFDDAWCTHLLYSLEQTLCNGEHQLKNIQLTNTQIGTSCRQKV